MNNVNLSIDSAYIIWQQLSKKLEK